MIQAKLVKLRVEILDITPPIWRLVVVPEGLNLNTLHFVIQGAFGWTNSHMHDFRTNTQHFVSREGGFVDEMFEDEGAGDLPEAAFSVSQVLQKTGAAMVYTYDFGDNWEHLITQQGPCAEGEAKEPFVVLDGARACPPEDCGGTSGYEDLLEAMRNPRHPEREEFIQWLGGEPFDPEAFDLGEINARLARLMNPPRRSVARSRRTERRGKRRRRG